MIDVFSETVQILDTERTSIERAAQEALDYEGQTGDLTILIDTPDHIQELNRSFRNVDRVTAVLTFTASDGESWI